MVQRFVTNIKTGLKLIPQPDAFTCQAASIAMMTDRPDTVAQVRSELTAIGVAGDPGVMGIVLRRQLGDRYVFNPDASLSEAVDWLKKGALLITHGWFTRSGHVIVINGVEIDSANMSYRFQVQDPWSEFNARSWAYNLGTVGYSGFYSSRLVYSTCVVGQSVTDARRIYDRGELDSNRRGMWLHIRKP